MKLSQAIAKRRDMVVEFDGANLRVTYRPTSFTIRELDELNDQAADKSQKPSKQLLATIKRTVVSWDLTDEYDNLIRLDAAPDDPNDPLLEVPSVVFIEIMRKVSEDQQPGGDRASSGR